MLSICPFCPGIINAYILSLAESRISFLSRNYIAGATSHVMVQPAASPPAPRYNSIASHLVTLPPEIVHQVLSDLSLAKILELINTHPLPYIDYCLCSHIDYGTILSSHSAVAELKGYYGLYMRVVAQYRYPSLPEARGLWDAKTLIRIGATIHSLIDAVKAEILLRFEMYLPYLLVLNRYSPDDAQIPDHAHWKFGTLDAGEKRWESLSTAENTINSIKEAQLQRIIALVNLYPGMLRQHRYGSQCPRSEAGIQHSLLRQKNLAREVKRPHILLGKKAAYSIFCDNRLPWVPFDRTLRLFLKTLLHFPVGVARESKSNPNHTVSPYEYPPEISESITTSINGMAYVFVQPSCSPASYNGDEPNDGMLLRTRYTPYSAEQYKRVFGVFQPQFHSVFETAVRDSKRNRKLGDVYGFKRSSRRGPDMMLPFDEREFVWLEAFLKSCRYMEGMDEVWTTGMTVADYWKKH